MAGGGRDARRTPHSRTCSLRRSKSNPSRRDDTPELADGATELTHRTPELADGTTELTRRTPELADGTTELTQRTPELARRTPELADGTTELARRTPSLADGTTELARRTPELAHRTTELARGNRCEMTQKTAGAKGAMRLCTDHRVQALAAHLSLTPNPTGPAPEVAPDAPVSAPTLVPNTADKPAA